MATLDSKIPAGPIAEKWSNYKAHQKLVNPKNKRKLDVIVVGTGLAGASAAASLGEMGFKVKNFCIQDSPRRAHSIAAQGGINAAKNYQNDGDSVYRLFYDTVKGGDYRAREANVYRLAEVSANIIDQCVAQGVPFAREYGGMLANRSFGGAQVSRTFYAKGQTGQQLLLGAYSSLMCQVNAGTVQLYTRYEMLDLVIIDGRARGIIARNLVTGKIERFSAHAVVIGTGGYGNTYFLSTNAMGCNCSAAMACYRKGAMFANPSYVQIHPTCIPVHGDKQSKLTLMSESLRNDGRIWVPKKLEDAKKLQAGEIQGYDIPEEDRDYYLERRYPAFGNLVPRDVASRAAKERCDKGFGVNNTGLAVFLDFSESINRLGIDQIMQRYGNLFEMYEEITDVFPGDFAKEINGVKLLVMGTVDVGGSGCVCPEHVMLKSILAALTYRKNDVVIMDMEAGLEHLGRGTAGNMDQFIVVIEPGARSVQTYRNVKRLACDLGVKRVRVVANKVRNESDEAFVRGAIPPEDLLGCIHYNPDIIDADRQGKSPYDFSPEAIEEIRNIKAILDREEN